MQLHAVIQQSKNLSLRKKIISKSFETKLEFEGFEIKSKQTERTGKEPGWTKLTCKGTTGTINFRWNQHLQGLEIWTIGKDPLFLYGRFLAALEGLEKKEIKSGYFYFTN